MLFGLCLLHTAEKMNRRNSREAYEMQEFPGEVGALDDGAREDQSPDTASLVLPPSDGGKAAWTLLLAAFVFEALLWGRHISPLLTQYQHLLIDPIGFPLSFGVFQDFYSQLPQFKKERYIPVVGTSASGISYLAAPIAIPLTKRFSKYRRHMIFVGCENPRLLQETQRQSC